MIVRSQEISNSWRQGRRVGAHDEWSLTVRFWVEPRLVWLPHWVYSPSWSRWWVSVLLLVVFMFPGTLWVCCVKLVSEDASLSWVGDFLHRDMASTYFWAGCGRLKLSCCWLAKETLAYFGLSMCWDSMIKLFMALGTIAGTANKPRAISFIESPNNFPWINSSITFILSLQWFVILRKTYGDFGRTDAMSPSR